MNSIMNGFVKLEPQQIDLVVRIPLDLLRSVPFPRTGSQYDVAASEPAAQVERAIVDDKRIMIKMRRAALLGTQGSLCASDEPSGSTIELTAVVGFKRRGGETTLVLPGLAQQNHASRCDPALIKAIARGRAWFEELATGRARSLQNLANRDGITRRYIRRLVDLAFLSPQLVEAILPGRQSVALTATQLTELDLPLDWTEQHSLFAN